jgi:hypothetical protein
MNWLGKVNFPFQAKENQAEPSEWSDENRKLGVDLVLIKLSSWGQIWFTRLSWGQIWFTRFAMLEERKLGSDLVYRPWLGTAFLASASHFAR